MVRKITGALATAAVAFAIASPAEAQQYRFDLGVKGGFSWYSDMVDDESLGLTDAEDLKFETGWLTGAEATFWLSPRLGLRANGTWSERPLTLGSFDEIDATDETTNIIEDVNLWSLSGDLMFRFATPNETWMGREVLPYLALGAGAKWIDPAVDQFTTADGEDAGLAFTEPQSGQRFLLGEGKKLMGLAALGADVRLSPMFSLRLEAGDRFWDAPLHQLEEVQTTPGNFVIDDDAEDFGKVVHELYASLGLHLLLGLQEREQVVVAPAPPAPPAAPAPPAPPAPREEAVTVCVIDPATGEAGLRTVQATYLIEERDTVVTVNGRRVAIEETVTVPVAGEADWFVAGQPMAFNVGNARAEFVTFGTSRIIERDLVFLGRVNGLPVYAARTDVTDLNNQLVDMRDADDLEDWLGENREFRDEFNEIDVVYVPLQPIGCVFQPLQRVEEVRKGGK